MTHPQFSCLAGLSLIILSQVTLHASISTVLFMLGLLLLCDSVAALASEHSKKK